MIGDDKRLLLVGSPWHAVLAAAIKEDNDRYIVENVSEKSYKTILKILDTDKIVKVVEACEFYFSGYLKAGRIFKLPKLFLKVRRLVSVIQGIDSDCLLIFSDESEISRIITNSVAWSRVIKLEDGVCDYLPVPLRPPSSPLVRYIRFIGATCLGVERYYRKILGKIDEVYLFRPDVSRKFSQAKWLDIPKLDIHKELILLCDDLDVDMSDEAVLVVGQTLYEDGAVSLIDEVNMYRFIADKCVNEFKGEVKIFFKPHPRSCNEKLELLSDFMEANSQFEVLHLNLPVEALMTKFDFKAVFGMWSNPILLGRRLFGTETYTMMHQLSEKLEDGHLVEIHRNLNLIFTGDYCDYRSFW